MLLFALAHPRWEFVFQPTYAAYLNLIEPWWKVLRSLALKGRRFETWAEVCPGGRGGHRLLERPSPPLRLGPAQAATAARAPPASPASRWPHRLAGRTTNTDSSNIWHDA